MLIFFCHKMYLCFHAGTHLKSLSNNETIKTHQMIDSNKPPEILEKIITGQLRKFYEQICLTEQSHMIEEGNPKVGKFLKESGLTVKHFKLVETSK